MPISFICHNSKFSLAFVIFSDTLNDTSLQILLEKVSSFKLYNSLNFLTLSIPFYFVSCQMLSKALILTKSHYVSMMRKNLNSQRWNKSPMWMRYTMSLNVGGNGYHPEKASTTLKKWEDGPPCKSFHAGQIQNVSVHIPLACPMTCSSLWKQGNMIIKMWLSDTLCC